MPRLTPGYLEMSQDEYDWLQAIAKMNEDSVKSTLFKLGEDIYVGTKHTT
jgi:hypothetical protein